jgi:hypothetical protein
MYTRKISDEKRCQRILWEKKVGGNGKTGKLEMENIILHMEVYTVHAVILYSGKRESIEEG